MSSFLFSLFLFFYCFSFAFRFLSVFLSSSLSPLLFLPLSLSPSLHSLLSFSPFPLFLLFLFVFLFLFVPCFFLILLENKKILVNYYAPTNTFTLFSIRITLTPYQFPWRSQFSKHALHGADVFLQGQIALFVAMYILDIGHCGKKKSEGNERVQTVFYIRVEVEFVRNWVNEFPLKWMTIRPFSSGWNPVCLCLSVTFNPVSPSAK